MKYLMTTLAVMIGAFLAGTVHAQMTQTQMRGTQMSGGMNFGQGNSYDEIIKNDHKVITSLINDLMDNTKKNQRGMLFDSLKKGLHQHMAAEEKYIYPVLEKNPQYKADAQKAKDEHAAAKAELAKIDPNAPDATFMSRLDVLKTMLNAHVQFEEGQLLPEADKIISPEDRAKITNDFKKIDR
jgi:hemerythrin-like domain-containing protein